MKIRADDYDENGNISQIVDATQSETLNYTYDELDRLDTVSGPYSQNYDYNTIGNLTSKTASANPGTTNLIAWWRMNETSGTRDDSHSTHDLADHNTVGSTTGKKGNAALFVAANSEYLDIPDNAALSMGAGARMTVCTWVKLNSKNATQIQEFVAKSGSASGSWEYFLRYDGVSDRFEYAVTSNGSTVLEANANTFGSPSTSTWYFLCGGYDGTNIWVSVNAGARDTATFSADIYDGASTNALQVGRYAGGSQYLDGALDEVVIYKRSLSSDEVGWLYNNGNGRAYADLSSGTAYTYNASHKHAVASLSTGESYSYDANGNMITRVEGGLTYTQTFDAENRLISVAVGGQTTQFIYDGDGNLVKKIKPDNSKTIHVGGIYEVDKSSGGSVTRTVTYYPAAGAMRINSTLYYTLKDHLGSASVVTNDQGIEVGTQRYYPFGETRLTTGTIYTDKLFTGQREMASLGIYHYQARFYSPKLGRFLSADTIVPGYANPQNLNRFSYVRNNPLRYTDPTGHYVPCEADAGECHHDPAPSPAPSPSPDPDNGNCHNDPDCRNDDGGLPDSDGDNGVINDIFETIIHDDLQALEDNDCFTQSPGTIDWTNSTCLDAASFLLQDIATLSSSVSASWTATLTILGCAAEGVGCVAGYGIGYADHLMFFNPLESTASGFSFGLTAYSDWLTHDTYFNSSTDWGVGEDTKTGSVTFVTGSLVVEPFFDAGIDIYASGYNHGYFCGISTLAGCIGSTIINAFP